MAGERTLPGIGLRAYWTPGSNGWQNEHDPDTRKVSALVQCSVISRVAAVPGSPSNGDMHILTAAPNSQAIAVRDNGAWVYFTPEEGWLAFDRGANVYVFYDGTAWRVMMPAVGGNGLEYVRVNAAETGFETAPISVTVTLDELSDVVITSPATGQVVRYNGTNWINDTIPGGTLDSLTDVVITSPATGQVVRYNGTNWINDTVPGSATDLNGLSDVIISSPADTQVLYYNGTNWINDLFPLERLSDVVISSPTTGQIIRYNGTNWINDTVPGASSTLDSLTDVVITSPATGQVVRYDGTNWINDTIAGGLADAPSDGVPYVRRNAAWEALQRNLDVSTQTSNYTLALSDRLGYVRMNSASANTLTVPTNASVAFPTGTVIQIRQVGVGQTTVAGASGVTVNSPETLKARKQGSSIALIKVGTNEWDLTGDLETL